MKLEGKVALVTGASRGIGRGIAIALAVEGAEVAVADLEYSNAEKVSREVKELGRRAIAIETDVTNWNDVKDMVHQTVETLGQLDIMVNNAGVASVATVEELGEEAWDRVMEVNAKGVFLSCKAVIPHMKQRGSGKIINVASIAGKRGCATLAHYCASKFAVVGFSRSLALELARDRVTVNVICPGIVRTDMYDLLIEAWKEPDESNEEFFERHLDEVVPLGRAQTPEDMGGLVVYFATADNVTGQAFNVDGGVEGH